MGKRKNHKHDKRNSKRRVADDDAASEDMDDEIDAFHRKRDVIPLDINDDAAESDEDAEHPVFNLESNANVRSENVDELKEKKKKKGKLKQGDNQMSRQSMEMLKARALLEEKIRALLEEKIKQKDITLIEPKQNGTKKHLLPINQKLEAYDDFDDDALAPKRKGQDNYANVADLLRLVAAKQKKLKVVSGDDDLPTRDDIGERRRRYELQMMARAGIESKNDTSVPKSDNDGDNGAIKGNGQSDSKDEFYKQVKQQRAAKLAAKAEIYSRTMTIPSSPVKIVNRRRKISYEMEKN